MSITNSMPLSSTRTLSNSAKSIWLYFLSSDSGISKSYLSRINLFCITKSLLSLWLLSPLGIFMTTFPPNYDKITAKFNINPTILNFSCLWSKLSCLHMMVYHGICGWNWFNCVKFGIKITKLFTSVDIWDSLGYDPAAVKKKIKKGHFNINWI